MISPLGDNLPPNGFASYPIGYCSSPKGYAANPNGYLQKQMQALKWLIGGGLEVNVFQSCSTQF